MTMPRQRNFIIEHEDDIQISGNAELSALVAKLPSSDTISVSDISSALNCSRSVVYAWIDSGRFKIINKGGTDRPFYYAFRTSFIDFLKTRIK